MSDRTDPQAAMEPLRAPADHDLVERVAAERLSAQPRLRAVGAAASPADLESQLTEERAARKKAEAAANEMALLLAGARTELNHERQARAAAEETATQMAALIAREHERTRNAEHEARLAWAQVPMVDQRDIVLDHPTLGQRARRAFRR